MGRKLTAEEFITKARAIHGDKYDYSKAVYTNNAIKINIVCKEHGSFYQTPHTHLQRRGCPTCSKSKTAHPMSHDQFISKANKRHKDKYIYTKTQYINSTTPVIITCPKHGDFIQIPSAHLYKYGCPSCKQSKGVIAIRNFLTVNKIPFNPEKSFVGCVYKLPLRFDFYLPEYNMIIEYDGKQHFVPIKYFGGEMEFQELKIRDSIKNRYCYMNNITLIRIPYYKINDIEIILSQEILKRRGDVASISSP